MKLEIEKDKDIDFRVSVSFSVKHTPQASVPGFAPSRNTVGSWCILQVILDVSHLVVTDEHPAGRDLRALLDPTTKQPGGVAIDWK